MTLPATTINLADVNSWGPRAHNCEVVINPPYPLTNGTWVVDVENNPDGSCAGVGITDDGVVIHYFTPEAVAAWPRSQFKNVEIVAHNAKYDVQMLRKWGFEVSPDRIVWDTQLAEHVKDSTRNRYGLKKLVQDVFNVSYPDFKMLTGAGKKAVSIGSLPVDIVAAYNGCDVLFTFRLMRNQLKEMSPDQLNYMEAIELPTMRVLLEMEERGVQIDTNFIRDLDTRFSDELLTVVNSIRDTTKSVVNLNSPTQVKQLLLEQAGLALESTAAEELKKHQSIPLIKNILRYRELSKLKGTYTQGLLERASGFDSYRLHARFNQTSTNTGRLSSSEPNLQNIPTRTDEGDLIRRAFVAKPGHVLLDIDFSQIEPRLMAHFSQDPVFLKIFTDGKSIYDAVIDILGLIDLYKGDASEAKRAAKIMWLALAYNAGAFKLSQAAGITRNQAEVFIQKMRLSLSAFFYWRDKVIAKAQMDGGVTTLLGRFIPLPVDQSHLGPNYIIQGSAAEVNKLALMAIREYGPVINCHDEVLFELPESEADKLSSEIQEKMTGVVELYVPLAVSAGIGTSWSAAKA